MYLYTEFDVAVSSGSLALGNRLEEKCTLNEIYTLEFYKETFPISPNLHQLLGGDNIALTSSCVKSLLQAARN